MIPDGPTRANFLVQHIYSLDGPKPDWLTPHYHDFPRHARYEEMTHHAVVMPDNPTASTLASHMVWIVENLNGAWTLTTNGFVFEDPLDATLFAIGQ